ncbi:MAG: RdgB/HAM1 family non-canonical purine NTP pyrophosphatase [Actinomycetes bacterium]
MTDRRVLLATKNQGKLKEFLRIITELHGENSLELLSADDFPDLGDIEETGATFIENALLKARESCRITGVAAIADDSGICVDALNGMPGIYSARWAGSHGNDRANLELLLAQLSHVPIDRRAGSFRCAVALVFPDGRELVEEGVMPGYIIDQPRGSGGFGYDPIFVAEGHEVTTAELSPSDKDAISHRGKAFRALAPRLLASLESHNFS